MPNYKLYYWKVPGRGEAIRLAFHVAGLQFEDVVLNGASYGELKVQLGDSCPLVNLPLLQIDDAYFTESKSILRYVGTVGGLMPSEPIKRLKIDEIIDFTDCIFAAFGHTFSITDFDEKVKARLALVSEGGALDKIWLKIDLYLSKVQNFITGDELTIGDIALFSTLCVPVSGFIDGIPLDVLDKYPHISEYRRRVGTHPKVITRYQDLTEGNLFIGYKMNK